MNLSKLLAVALTATLAPVGAHAARDAQADAQAVAGDLAPTALVSNAGKTLRDNPDQQPVSFSWAIEADTKLTPAKPFVSDSREFWTNVDALDLAKGFRFQTTAPGAVIRISPTASVGSKAAIAPGVRVPASRMRRPRVCTSCKPSANPKAPAAASAVNSPRL